jgi:hypothetical protein
MNWAILGGAIAAVIAVLVFRVLSERRGKPARPGFQKKDFLLSPEERLFFTTLKQAVGEDYEIFGRIQAFDVLSPRSGSGRNVPRDEFETIREQHFPFVLCKKGDLSIACAMQLREHSFGGKKSSAPADVLKSVCHAAGLPFVIIESGPMYDINEIRESIAAAVCREPLYLTESDGRKEPRISGLENFEL